MEVTYRLKPHKLTVDFFNALKTTFHDREISISVKTIQDETDYFLRSEENRRRLLKSVDNVKNKRFVYAMTIEKMAIINEQDNTVFLSGQLRNT